VRVVIAEDSLLLREGLTLLLEEAGVEVVAAVEDAESFLRAVETTGADGVIIDVRMPPTFTDEGLRAAIVVRRRWPHIGVLVLSQWVEERYATELLTGPGQGPGGIGYLLKDRVGDIEQFVDALRRVIDGGSALDPDVVAQLLTRRGHPLDTLSTRERHVLALMAEGRSNSAIAASLVIGIGAVEKHVNSIFTKLGLDLTDTTNRRVLAVLTYLGDGGRQPERPCVEGG
jgi:DNA-binding NarL/FixJ family response regulator